MGNKITTTIKIDITQHQIGRGRGRPIHEVAGITMELQHYDELSITTIIEEYIRPALTRFSYIYVSFVKTDTRVSITNHSQERQ